MVLEREILPYLEWLIFGPQGFGAIAMFLFLLLIIALAALFICFAFAAVRLGPIEAFYTVAQVIAGSVPDFIRTSPRRVWAIAHLSIKESIRRKVIVGFIIFAILLLYAGWFLDVRSDHPARLYLSFAMTATNYLVLILALLLSTLSLPADIKNRTIYTVVTKPVRAVEIVFGRFLGFTCVGTVLLATMGLVSYGFVVRNLSHQHQLDADPAVIEQDLREKGEWIGETTQDKLHRHTVKLTREALESGEGIATSADREHWHVVRRSGEGADARYTMSGPRGQLLARVPIYGSLRFMSRTGAPGRGINVGNEWTYREYIQGGTLAAAVWTFDGIDPQRFPDGLPLELNIRIYRTVKGDIERGVLGTMTIKNPNTSARINSSIPYNFEAKEFVISGHKIPRKLQAIDSSTSEIKEVDLFEDLAPEGRVEVWIQCAEHAQYFGMAQADAYLRALDRPFYANFAKGYVGIWLQMLLVICFGVTFSTFLSGPIAILGTVGVIVLGLRTKFIVEVLGGVVEGNPLITQFLGRSAGEESVLMGGGPIESFIRLVTQKNVMVDLDMHWLTEAIIHWIDLFLMTILWAVSQMLPDFAYFNTADYVANGFNVDTNLLLQQGTVALAFTMVLTVVGYFFLKTREIAA